MVYMHIEMCLIFFEYPINRDRWFGPSDCKLSRRRINTKKRPCCTEKLCIVFGFDSTKPHIVVTLVKLLSSQISTSASTILKCRQ